jgi:hypothetical protein
MSKTVAAHIVRAFAPLAFGFAVASCAVTGESSIAVFADPGKYQYHNCDQLISAGVALNTRQKELDLLIEAASASSVGTALSVIAYRGEHRQNAEEIVMIERAARAKDCLTSANWRSNMVIR